MSVLYLDCNNFVRLMEQKGYETYIQKGSFLCLYSQKRYYVFQILRGNIIANYLDMQIICGKDTGLFNALLGEPQPKNKTPHADGLIYDGVTYHYAFEFKLASIGKTVRVVTSNFNYDTNDFSGLCLENGFKVISIKKARDDAFLEIVKSVIDGYLSVDKIFKKEHHGEELVQILEVKDKDFIKKLEECKKSKESMDLNKMLNEKMMPYFEGQSDVREIPKKIQIDFINGFPTALLSIPKICSKIPIIERVAFYTTCKGGFWIEQHVARSA